MDRRTFLSAGAATAGSLLLAGCSQPTPSYPEQSGEPYEGLFEGTGAFPSGVISADPLPDAVLLWTRVHPTLDRGLGIDCTVEISEHPDFIDSRMVAAPTAVAASDYCVTVDATNLQPATTYWYRFHIDGHTSRLGRTKTAPRHDDPTARLRIAAFSCQRWTHGWYTAHNDLASLAADPSTDIDVVLSLGDYIYNTGYADGVLVRGRHDPVQSAMTRDEFRSKYRLYRSDPALAAVHALYPVVSVFDNHDGLEGPGDPQADGALAAFYEHVPVRTPEPGRIHRSFRWGALAEFFLTDQRTFRDPVPPKAGPLGTSSTQQPIILDRNRTMLGLDQRAWLSDGLSSSDASWRVIGGQMMFWPWRTLGRFPGQPRGSGVYLNLKQWDGYVGERLELLDRLERDDVRDTLMFTGDSHVFSAAQVAPDVDNSASIPRILEVGTGSVTSNNADESGLPDDDLTWPLLSEVNANHLRYLESARHGYVVAELTGERTAIEMRSPRTIRSPESDTTVIARFEAIRGRQQLTRLPR